MKYFLVKEAKIEYKRNKVLEQPKFNSAEKIYKFFSYLKDKEQEEIIAVYLDRSLKCIAYCTLFIGTVSVCVSDPKIIVRNALLMGSENIILIHNHPSGETEPSEADKKITEKIKQACNYFDIKLIDHLIIGDDYYSFQEENLL